MRKKILLLVVSVLLSLQIFAKDVSSDRARKVAIAFLQQSTATTLKSAKQIELTLVDDFLQAIPATGSVLKSANTDSPEMFAFNINQNTGFIIVSGDDASFPILGYSDEQGITTNDLPPNIASWLDHYRQQIRYLKEHKIEPTEDVKMLWEGVFPQLKSAQGSVAPLLRTKWNQSPYFNAKCPYDSIAQKLTLTGCAATAMAQILKYWEYPSRGVGFHSYRHKKYGILSADYDTTLYNWMAMPDSLSGPNGAIASLMYDCGVAIDMVYGVKESGAFISPRQYDVYAANVFDATKTYFGYSKSIQSLARNYRQYPGEWTNILKSELDDGRPVLYEGYNEEHMDGHAFVCDGYDDNNNLHMNWGWGGWYNGYYRLDALIPPNKYNFNYYHGILIGIKPPDDALAYQLILTSHVAATRSEIGYEDVFAVTANIQNKGLSEFKGDFSAVIFDDQFRTIDTVEIKTLQNIGAGANFPNGLSFSTNRLSTMVPGNYRVYIRYRGEGGEWITLQTDLLDTVTKNFAKIEVSNKNMISLFTPIYIQKNMVQSYDLSQSLYRPIYPNDSLTIWLNIANDSTIDFTGALNLSVYTLKGDFVTTFDEKPTIHLASKSHFADSLKFYNPKLELPAGTYLLKLRHKWEGGDYEYTGSAGLNVNPVRFTVDTLIEKDQYEDNDSPYQISDLKLNFINNKAIAKTEGANIHWWLNLDFFSITMEPGYDYSINARLQDSMNNNDGETYSLDALVCYSTDGITISEQYDAIVPDTIEISGGGKIFFMAWSNSIYDLTGTYALEIHASRTLITSTEPTAPQNDFKVFPNPFTDKITISGNDPILKFELIDTQGRLLKKAATTDQKNVLDFSNLSKGVYFLKIITNKGIYSRKIIKQ